MKWIPPVVAGLIAGVALAVAAGTYAQPFGGMGPGPGVGMGMGMGMGMGPGHGPMDGVEPAAMADSRLSEMKTQLKITTAQEAAWQTFADAAKQQAASMQALHTPMHQGAGTAPEQMAQHTQAMQQRAAGMATMTNVFNALYAVLNPEQKAIVDQNFGMTGHRGMGHGRTAG